MPKNMKKMGNFHHKNKHNFRKNREKHSDNHEYHMKKFSKDVIMHGRKNHMAELNLTDVQKKSNKITQRSISQQNGTNLSHIKAT